MGRGRPRAFDEAEVLRRAAAQFREHGFAATSMQTLSDAMGMAEQSIYNAFGNKQQVFARAVGQYCDEGERHLFGLAAPDAGRAEIEALLFGVADALAGGELPCLALQTSLLDDHKLTDAGERVHQHLKKVEGYLRRAVENGVASGDIRADDPKATARFLNMTLQGLNVTSRSGAGKRALRQAVTVALRALD